MNCQNHPESARHCLLPYVRNARLRRLPPRRFRNGLLRRTRPGPSGRRGAPAADDRRRFRSSAPRLCPSATAGSPLARICMGHQAYPIPARPGSVSPALAFFLGLIPGVGAIYNGQYAKGIVHGLVWGLLMSIANSRAANGLEPIFVMLVIVWWAYMAIEAHRTAQLIAAGQPVDEFSSIVSLNGRGDQAVVAGVILVVLGVILLLRTLNVLDIDELMARYWPVLLIAGGAWLLWGRISGHNNHCAARGGAP